MGFFNIILLQAFKFSNIHQLHNNDNGNINKCH